MSLKTAKKNEFLNIFFFKINSSFKIKIYSIKIEAEFFY